MRSPKRENGTLNLRREYFFSCTKNVAKLITNLHRYITLKLYLDAGSSINSSSVLGMNLSGGIDTGKN